jgi:hypothetical protein
LALKTVGVGAVYNAAEYCNARTRYDKFLKTSKPAITNAKTGWPSILEGDDGKMSNFHMRYGQAGG